MFKLVLIQGPADIPKEYILREKNYRIGRSPEAEISIDSEFISKFHAVIQVALDQAILEDLNSRNGTFVNGVMIKKVQLKHKDRISFQNLIFEFHKEQASAQKYNLGRTESITGSSRFQWIKQWGEDLTQKIEWKYLTLILVMLFISVGFVSLIPPLLNEAHIQLQKEALKRGEFIVKQISRENQRYLTLENETLVTDTLKLSTTLAQSEERITLINIVDPKTKRILAPSERLNQTVENNGPFLRGSEAKALVLEKISEYEFLISFPIWIYSRQENREVIGAVIQAVFQIEGTGYTSAQYTNLLIRSFLILFMLGVVLYILLHWLTLSAFKKIDSEIQQASRKGYRPMELQTKFHEISQVIDSINQVFRRTRDLVQKLPDKEVTESERNIENTDEILRHMIQTFEDGVVVLNNAYKIIKVNPAFSKIARTPSLVIDQNILDIIQDQELLRNISHSLNQAAQGEQVKEDFFLGNQKYRLTAEAARNRENIIDFYLLNLKQVE